jgi:N-acetylmuramoyl-L-alanine amidase
LPKLVPAIALLSACLALLLGARFGAGSTERATPSNTDAFAGIAPPIRHHPIPYGAERKRDMAAYAKRHYGHRSYRLRNPHVIVEHIAVTNSAQVVWNTFAPNRPDPELGELPGLCAHYVISGRGHIQQLVPPRLMCRHTVGLNYTAIGIEHTGYADGDLLGNRRQLRASLRLTRWLRCSRGIRVKDVIGHNESLSSPYHHERVRRLRTQTHGDMSHRSMRVYRRKLRRHPCPAEATAHAARVVLGHSTSGRPIVAYRLGDHTSDRTALVVGSVHGDERAGLAVVRALRRRANLDGVDLWVVPTFNPDGLRAGQRQNGRGVDLNRNFSYRWREAGYRWSRYYSGPRPFSEPESRAVRRFTRRLQPDVSIWYHQPWGHVVVPRRNGAAARRYGRLAHFPAHRLHGARAHLRGTAVSWQSHAVRGSSAFVVELPAQTPGPRAIARHARAAVAVARGR